MHPAILSAAVIALAGAAQARPAIVTLASPAPVRTLESRCAVGPGPADVECVVGQPAASRPAMRILIRAEPAAPPCRVERGARTVKLSTPRPARVGALPQVVHEGRAPACAL